MGKIRISKGHAVPLILRIGTLLLLCFIFYVVASNLPELVATLIVMSLSLVGSAIWFSFRILTIDSKKKTIHEGVWVMNRKMGKDITFNSIESIYSEKIKKVDAYNPLPLYSAFLKLEDGSVYTLLTNKSKKEVSGGISRIKKKLDLK